MNTKQNATVLLLVALAVGAWFLVPPSGSYRLKSGHAACPTKEGVVAYRGAHMFGPLAAGLVIASKGCEMTSAPLLVLRRSTMFDLPYRISISGRVMYADHDALEKV